MPSEPPDGLSDSRMIGLAARAVRRLRNMTAAQVAGAMNLPLRTYEYFEAGAGRVNLHYIHRFAAVTDCDPYALLLGPSLASTEFARRTADTKLVLIFLIALSEFERSMGDRLQGLDPRALIEAFSEAFRKLEAEHRQRGEEVRSWLEAGHARISGRSPSSSG